MGRYHPRPLLLRLLHCDRRSYATRRRQVLWHRQYTPRYRTVERICPWCRVVSLCLRLEQCRVPRRYYRYAAIPCLTCSTIPPHATPPARSNSCIDHRHETYHWTKDVGSEINVRKITLWVNRLKPLRNAMGEVVEEERMDHSQHSAWS